MNPDTLKQAVEGFEEINYRQVMVERNQNSYDITTDFVSTEVSRLVDMYRELTTLDQRARLIRDGIDLYLRRGHGYNISGSIGAHYRQAGVDPENNVFEHMNPQARVRDLLIQDRVTIPMALNTPTCLISPENDALLNKAKLNNKTPSYWFIFKRYVMAFDAEFETFNGQRIDPETYTLWDHYKMCGLV